MWIQTFTGKKFNFSNLADNEYDILDIAHSLAMTPRYGGHCIEFYSIAEHCVLMHDFCIDRGFGDALALLALLHDAPEAYIGDMTNPLKVRLRHTGQLADYERIDKAIMGLIGVRHSLPLTFSTLIKEIDFRIRGDERANMTACEWDAPPEPLGISLHLWSPKQAEHEFIKRYRDRRFKLGYGQVL